MDNYVFYGNLLIVSAPYDVFAGDCVQVGAFFGVAKNWSPRGAIAEIFTTGVFDVKKSKFELWDVGHLLYWNEQTRLVTSEPKTNQRCIGVVVAPTGSKSPDRGQMKILYG